MSIILLDSFNKDKEILRLQKILKSLKSSDDNFLNKAPMHIILYEIKKEEDIRKKLEILLGFKSSNYDTLK